MNTITVQIKSVYGQDKIYPICDTAKLFASIAGTKTITKDALISIHQLGFKIEVEHDELILTGELR